MSAGRPVCAGCGFLSDAGLRFCGRCGRALGGDGARAVEAPVDSAVEDRERRQLVILFCDLAGSTTLASRMDDEDFGELISDYFLICDSIFRRHGGYVDREEGDSLRVYFGYPVAGDEDADCAARAALDVVAAMTQLAERVGQAVEVRIGIATGEVIAADPKGGRRNAPRVVGQAPNVARRLEEAAPPSAIYTDAITYRLIGRRFEGESLGELMLKGLPKPVEAYRVRGAKARANSIEQFDRRPLAPMVSRDDEMAMLEQRWMLASQGRGQVVLFEGEPGIGKSRLMHAFLSRPERRHCRVLTAQCQQQFANSSLAPFVDLLQRTIGLQAGQTTAEQEALLQEAFASQRLPQADALPLVARLLGLPVAASISEPSPRVQREATLEWLSAWLGDGAKAVPSVLVVEDLHWADPSSLACLSAVMARVDVSRLLLLLTHRPDFAPPWPARPNVVCWSLERIDSADALRLVHNVAGARPLPDALVERVAAQSDGVPLFVEELTKMLVEARSGIDAQAWEDSATLMPIPETLRASLTARLDHLLHAKPIAQAAAVLGREFSLGLLRRVAESEEQGLHDALDELVEAELVFRRAGEAETYVFKHALVQEAAYLSLLKAPRARFHLRAAKALLGHFGELADRHPELPAHHFAAAGRPELAFEYWQRAGKRALDASADVEATGYLNLALGQLDAVADRSEHHQREVDCLVTLGSALTAMRGYAAAEVEQTFARAHALCETAGDADKLYSALTGLHGFYQVRGSLVEAVELGRRLVGIAEASGDTARRAQSHRCLGWSLFCNGQSDAGSHHLEIALELCESMRATQHARIDGAHPWIVGLVNSAWLECLAGNRTRALRRSRQSIELARDLGQPLPFAYALCMSAAMHADLHEPDAARRLSEESLSLALEHRMPYWSSWSSAVLGWALVHVGQASKGLEVLQRGLEDYRATGAQLFVGSSLALLARSHATVGNIGKAVETIDIALDHPLVATGYFYTPALRRLRQSLIAT